MSNVRNAVFPRYAAQRRRRASARPGEPAHVGRGNVALRLTRSAVQADLVSVERRDGGRRLAGLAD